MITTKDKILLGVGALLIVILVTLGILFNPKGSGNTEQNPIETPKPRPFTVRVESVEPLRNQRDVSVVPRVVVSFSASVSGKKVVLKTQPSVSFTTEVDASGVKATFNPLSNLKPKTKYNVQVLVDEEPIFSWSFTTKSGAISQENLSTVVNKIKKKMPVVEDGFRISYDAPGDHFFVFIEKTPISTYENKAKLWFKENGVKDLGALNISYVPKGSLTP